MLGDNKKDKQKELGRKKCNTR